MADIKSNIVENYLRQQMMQAGKEEDNDDQCQAIQAIQIPDDASLIEFKQNVRAWMEADNYIKKLQQAAKEKNVQKKCLTEKILSFMAKFNIEDLNTKDGKLRYKITYVKEPISQKIIKQKVSEYFTTTKSSDELVHKVFDEREKTPKPTLRRVNVR